MAQSVHADNDYLAVAGEGFACGVYEREGYELIDARVRTAAGELDLIMRAPDGTVVFVEVKTRSGRAFGAAEAVTAKKLRTMRRCAAQWLEDKPWAQVRFDVAEVLFTGEAASIQIFEDVDRGAC